MGADSLARQISEMSLLADSTDVVAAKLRALAENLSFEAHPLRQESERFTHRVAA
jgi:hypothetical protein